MRKIVLLALIISCAFSGYAQQHKRIAYLTVWFEKIKTGRFIYFVMNAERGNYPVPEVFDLVIFKSQNDLDKENIGFYHEQNDSAKANFNYFGNPTAGLEYLAKFGWQLVSVSNEVSSAYKLVNETGAYIPVTTVSSRSMYYLKKEME